MSINTVFIIGAGTSTEVGLPTGEGLKDEIIKLLDYRTKRNRLDPNYGDPVIESAFQIATRYNNEIDRNKCLYATKCIKESMPGAISIDNYIHDHRNDIHTTLCGKLAIVRSILNAERESPLFSENWRTDSRTFFERLSETWFVSFFKLFTENCIRDDLDERFNSTSFVIFNYDRCVEQFLYNALRIYYRLPEADAVNLISNMKIFHPYGSVGTLPGFSGNDTIGFGSELYSDQLFKLSRSIKTFTESTDRNSSEIIKIRDCIKNAERVVFLGFAFQRLNMKLIDPGEGTNLKESFASTYGFSKDAEEIITKQIKYMYRKRIFQLFIQNKTCSEFFAHYDKNLEF